jgi:outer membrane protein assembly factor BamD
MSKIIPLSAAVLACALLASSCASNRRNPELAYVERPVEQLYNLASERLDRRDYRRAIQLFEEVERQHPYSEWARRAMIMSAYANYRSRDYTTSVTGAERYLALHPGGSEAEYAYYLIALNHFDQIIDVGRDQATTERARDALLDVIRRFPASEYSRDARVKLDMVNDQLAGKEMTVGRWYLRSNQTLAAINRFRNVLVSYETTSHTPEALHRLVEAYLTIGMRDQALVAGATLGHNYPGSEWYRMSYQILTNQGLDPDAVSEPARRSFLQRILPGGN